jgi:putative NIF3 family GTP cyclohydrolase 1 type 2
MPMAITIRQAIDAIVAAVPGAPFADTVDVVKAGDPDRPVTGVVSTFLATYDVIDRAVQLGANLIITHEPTFYAHRDETAWLAGNAVYAAKRRLIDEAGVVIWRFHDYLHALEPDATVMGFLAALGWESHAPPDRPLRLPYVVPIPPASLDDLVGSLKATLGLGPVRVVGDPGLICRNVGLMLGAPGGERQVRFLDGDGVDVLLTGEVREWEVTEYARDAGRLGLPKALVVLGHAASEEAGMRWVVPWLEARLPGVPVTFLPTGGPFRWI